MQTDAKPLGVIDTLSAGFGLMVRRPGATLVPALLNFFLWQGPQISAHPIFQRVIALMNLPPGAAAPDDTAQGLEAFKQVLQSTGERFNLFELLGIAMPGLLVVGTPARQTLFVVSDAPSLFALIVAFTLAGLYLAALYLEAIARGVRQNAGKPLLRSFAQVTALVFILGGMGGLIAFPFLIAAALLAPLNPAIGAFLVMLLFLIFLWALLYLSFAVPAIFVGGANAWQAIVSSITIFRLNFWSALGLVFLTYLIQSGFGIVWEQIGDSAWGLAIDLIANAFIASGLVAALMLFYRDRVLWLAQTSPPARPAVKG